MVVIEHGSRDNKQISVHKVPNEDQDRYWKDELWVSFRIAGNHYVEWNREVDEEHQEEWNTVIRVNSTCEVDNLLWNVRVPYQHKLAEP